MGEDDLKRICNDLKQKLEQGVNFHSVPFIESKTHNRQGAADWCKKVDNKQDLCKELLIGLDVVLNPDEKEWDASGSTGYYSALNDKFCNESMGIINESWLETFGSWIGLGVTASRNINKKAKDAKNKLT